MTSFQHSQDTDIRDVGIINKNFTWKEVKTKYVFKESDNTNSPMGLCEKVIKAEVCFKNSNGYCAGTDIRGLHCWI